MFIDGDDINRIARYFGLSDGQVRTMYLEGKNTFKTREDGSCIFLHEGKLSQRCSIHQARPRQCSDFPYNKPCPYLYRQDLLEKIQPKVANSILTLSAALKG